MDIPPEVVQLGASLAESVARNTAASIADKIRALRSAGKQDETIAGLEEIIQGLIADKNELTRIAQSYQSELVSQNLTAGDIKYIAGTVMPLLEQLADAAPQQDGEKVKATIEGLKPLLSVETVNVLQLLGFNFRRAIGEPLTRLCERMIISRIDQSEALRMEVLRRDQLFVQLALDPEASDRFKRFFGHGQAEG